MKKIQKWVLIGAILSLVAFLSLCQLIREGMVFFVGVFVLSLIIVTTLFFFLSKTKKPIQLGMLYAIIHLILVCLLACSIYRSTDGEACMGWLIFFFIDMPSASLMWLLGKLYLLIFGYSFMVINYHIPFVVSAVFGSLQYFLVGIFVGWAYNKIFRPKVKEQFE
jgi:hypothetical protein